MTLVQAILFHGDDEAGRKKERRIVWELADIIAALDEEFPDMYSLYVGRNDSLSKKDMLERSTTFRSKLDRLNTASTWVEAGRGLQLLRRNKDRGGLGPSKWIEDRRASQLTMQAACGQRKIVAGSRSRTEVKNEADEARDRGDTRRIAAEGV